MDTEDSFPDFLFDTYKKYKFDTALFVSWLGERAQKCGGFSDHITSASSGKPKPKSSKKSGKKNTKPQPKTSIPLSQFPDLARAIADSDSDVPISILLVLKHIIRARGECADWFSCREGDEKHLEANVGHRHAINIFKEVLAILSPKSSMKSVAATKPTSGNLGDQGKTINLVNSFAALNVEDLDSDVEEVLIQTAVPKKKPKSYERVYELDDPLADYYMEMFFFFRDFHKLRLHIKQIWEDYRDGKVDLASASVTTEFAFEVLERNEQEFYESLTYITGAQRLDEYQMTAGALWQKVCSDRGLDWKEDPPELYDIQDSLCIHTFRFLNTYLSAQVPGQMTAVPWKGTKDIVPDRDRESLSPQEKLEEDKDVLWALLPDIQVLPAVSLATPGLKIGDPVIGRGVCLNDKLASGLQDAQTTRKITIWLVFAVQTLLDIFHITRQQTGRALAEVRLTASKHEESLRAYREFSRDKFSSSWSRASKGELLFNNTTTLINDWVYQDRIGKFRAALSPTLKRPHQFWLMTYHPMLCGSFIMSMNLTMQAAGRGLAHAWGCTIAALHLYNASISSKTNKTRWPDLDVLLSIHDEKFLFYGGAPRTTNEYCLKFWLSMGFSMSNLAKDGHQRRQRTGQGPGKTEQRKLTHVVSVSKIFEPRYCDVQMVEKYDYEHGSKLSMDCVKLLQEKAQLQKEIPRSNVQDFLHPYQGNLKKKEITKDPDQLSPVQLLDALCIALNSEYTALNFDYLSLHIRCMKLLRQLHTEIQGICRQMYGENSPNDSIYIPANFDTDEALGELPYFVFTSNVEVINWSTEKLKWKANDERGKPVSILLVKASRLVENLAREEGRAVLDGIDGLRVKCLGARAEKVDVKVGDEGDAKVMLRAAEENLGSKWIPIGK